MVLLKSQLREFYFLLCLDTQMGSVFQKLKYPALENYMYSHNVSLSHSFENMFYGFE